MSRARITVNEHHCPPHIHRLLLVSILALAICSGAVPQNSGTSDEIRGRSTAPPFQLHAESNLVDVRVVVRDPKGRTVSGLHKEDFRLVDNGKPQEISQLTAETAFLNPPATQTSPSPAPPGEPVPAPPARVPAAAQRFVGLYFDDFHLDPEGIGRTRIAAWRYILTEVRPQDRVALFTATGKDQLDFTSERDKLHEALLRIAPRVRSSKPPNACLDIGEYQAYLMDQHHDPDATEIADAEAYYCDCVATGMNTSTTDPKALDCRGISKWRATAEAAQVWSEAEMRSQYALAAIEISVRRLAAMPGQRTLVLVSTGFLTETLHEKIDAIINWALHQDVVISAVDAGGVYARVPHRRTDPNRNDLEPRKTLLENIGSTASRDVLASLADRTGGTFFHNSNDFDDGFRQTAAVPETYYVLSFSPTDFKPDGKFHSLKVTLNSPEHFTVEARRGYFATETALAGRAASQTEVDKVVFSQDEVRNLPVDITTKVEKLADQKSKLMVNIHVDVRSLAFRKDGDRSVNTLIFDTALFDNDGKYVTGKEGSLELHLKDATLQRILQTGINADTSFNVPPGTYRIREVVRDTESKQITSLNYVTQVSN
ncbi:MAG TPA: VWA domain-containing protein [Terriglobia bacterium]|nr:VWA domain-containing protein [Terriglobia bacterium]